MVQSIAYTIPLDGVIWTPGGSTDNFVLFYTLTILYILPAMLIDLILKFSGRRDM